MKDVGLVLSFFASAGGSLIAAFKVINQLFLKLESIFENAHNALVAWRKLIREFRHPSAHLPATAEGGRAPQAPEGETHATPTELTPEEEPSSQPVDELG
jgi:hypothetical protein